MKPIKFLLLVLLSGFSFSLSAKNIQPQKANSKDSSFQQQLGSKITDLKQDLAQLKALQSRISFISDSIRNSGAYTSLIDGKALSFPYAVLAPGSTNTDYALIINSVNLTAQGMKAEIFMQLRLSSDKRLTFIARDVPIDGSFTEMQLLLVESLEFKIGSKGYSVKFHGLDLNPDQNTSYVTFDCKGFKKMVIDGKLNFDPETITKYDSTETNKKDPFSLDFYVELEKLSSLLLEFDNIPALQFTSLPGFKCEMPKITLDLSDQGNVPGFELPTWYIDSVKQKYASASTFDANLIAGDLWEGVYVPELKFTIPKKFKEGSAKQEDLIIVAQDIIVDQFGVTALIHASNILTADKKANLNGFKLTIDSARVNIITSSLSFAGVYGKMTIPIQDDKSTLDYSITVTRSGGVNTYTGYAELNTNVKVNAFGLAKMGLTRAQLDFTLVAKKFRPTLEIDGTIAISPTEKDTSGNNVGLISLKFQKLTISSENPYLFVRTGGYVQLNSSIKSALYNLPIQVKKVAFINNGDKYGMNLELSFMLQNSSGSSQSSGNGFQAASDFTVWAKRDIGTKKYSYAGFDLNSLYINVKQGAFELEGQLNKFSGDSVYGNGFCGYLKVVIIDKITVECATIFGKKYSDDQPVPNVSTVSFTSASLTNDPSITPPAELETPTEYRYWFVDIKAQFPTAIPFAPGAGINSISGGLYYNMKMSAPLTKTAMKSDTIEVASVRCKTASGKEFTPFKGIFGIMAGIGIQSTGTGSAFNGEINLGIEFNLPGGGLRQIATWGYVNVMSDLKIPGVEKLASKANAVNKVPAKSATQATPPASSGETVAPINMNWFVSYDFPNKTLTGDFGVYVNIAGVIKGIGSDYKAGSVSFMACPDFWYVYIGQPSRQLMNGVSLIGLFELGSYMCVGTKLPDPAIASVPDGITNNPITAEDMMGLGSGFSFGARLRIGGSGEKNLVVFKVGYTALLEAGFDFMIAKSNRPITCYDGRVRGMNNWYALGQVYILGVIEVKAGLKSPSKKILGLSISAYVQAQLPDPNYYAGNVNIKVSFLKWSKSFDAEFEKGHKCDAAALNISEVAFFTDNFPENKEGDVSVFTPIAISLEKEIQNYKFKVITGGTTNTFRINTNASVASLRSSKGALNFDFEIDALKETLYIIPHEALPENDSIEVKFTLIFEKQTGSNWDDSPSLVAHEVRTYKFKTAKESATIEQSNVAYSYPMIGMGNVYTQETNKGYVKFVVNPKKSTTLHAGQQFAVVVYDNGKELERTTNVTVNTNRQVEYFNFDLPFARLDPSKEYVLKIMKVKIGTNSTQTTSTVGVNQIGAVQAANTDTVLIEIPFETSQYATFTDKMKSFSLNTSSIQGDIITASILGSTNEGFTDLEFYGDGKLASLVEFGNIDYNNQAVTDLVNTTKQSYSDLRNISTLSLSSIKSGFDIVNSQVDELKTFIDDRNATCLINNNCKSSDFAAMSIPAGEVSMKINYRLPGKTSVKSSYDFKVNLDKPISIQ